MLDISRLLDGQNNLSFFSLFEETRSPANVVATFLAVLELMKRNIVRLEQDRMFGDISLKKIQVD
jgi:chromatin segregation and condensation protein Rec8/ScpA/Scc1 (kleisin family)